MQKPCKGSATVATSTIKGPRGIHIKVLPYSLSILVQFTLSSLITGSHTTEGKISCIKALIGNDDQCTGVPPKLLSLTEAPLQTTNFSPSNNHSAARNAQSHASR